MQDETGGAKDLALNPVQRRVLGVLIEKGLSTPEYYPMTLKAITAGCNQKNNRAPLSQYDEEEVAETLESLKDLDLATPGMFSSGRAERWRQDLGRTLELNGVELAVMGELLLRGPQSEGELRGRANRMRPIADLSALREVLGKLSSHQPPLIRRLSPGGVGRGARYAHALYSPAEWQRVQASSEAAASEPTTNRASSRSPRTDLQEVLERLQRLEARVAQLESQMGGSRPQE
jgi:hypothetical protein